MADVFVSYAREDRILVRRLHDALVAQGKELWVDWEGIEPSDRWLESIREAIDGADAVVAVLSPAFLASQVCGLEVEHAASLNKRLIAVVVEEPGEGEVPEALAEVNWIFLRPEDDFDTGVDELVRAIETDLGLIRTHTRVLTRARAWELSGRRSSPLLRGEELRQAESWVAQAASGARPQPTVLQAEFVAASRRQATRRQRLAVAGSLLVAVLAAGLSVFAVLQRNEAEKQRDEATRQARIVLSRFLAGEARDATQADLAALLSLEAYRLEPAARARSAVAAVAQRVQPMAAVFGGGSSAVNAVAVASGAGVLAAAGDDGFLRFWRLDGRTPIGKPIAVGDGTNPSVWLSDDGETAVVASNNLVHRFRVDDGTRLGEPLEAQETFVQELAVSPDGRLAATVGVPATLRVYDLDAGELVYERPVAAAAVESVAFSPDGRYVLAGDNAGTVSAWVAETGEPFGEPLAAQPGVGVSALAFDPDGTMLATAGSDGGIRLWRFPSLESLGDPVVLQSGTIDDLAFSSDGQMLALAGDAGIVLWELYKGASHVLSGHHGAVHGVAFGPRDTLYSGGEDGTAVAWRLPPAPLNRSVAIDAFIRSLAFSPDGKTLAMAVVREGEVRFFDVRTLDPVGTPLTGIPQGLFDIAYRDEGTLAVWGDTSLAEWDVESRTPSGEPTTFPAEVVSGALSGDGRVFAAGLANGSIQLVGLGDAAPADRELTAHEGRVESVAFTPDGTMLVSGGEDGRLAVWDVATGERVAEVADPHSGPVESVAAGSQGIASGGPDTLIRLWSLDAGGELRSAGVLRGHTGDITGLDFSPDGRTLASSSMDGSVRLWDVAATVEIGEPPLAGTARASGVVFGPDEGTLATWRDVDAVLTDARLWTESVARSHERLCAVASRNLTQDEWREFLPGQPYRTTCLRWPAGS